MVLKDKLWKYRGYRILPHMRNGVRNSILMVFIPIFLLGMYVSFRNHFPTIDWLDINQYQVFTQISEWNWLLIARGTGLSILIGLVAVVIAYLLFHEKYKSIWHRQKITRMFFSNRFVEEQRVQTESQWSEKQVSKNKITYFPRAYYKKRRVISISELRWI